LSIGVDDDELGHDNFIHDIRFRQLLVRVPKVNALPVISGFNARLDRQQREGVRRGSKRGCG